jgi:TolA-binding protein
MLPIVTAVLLVPPALGVLSGCGSGQEAQMEELSYQNSRLRAMNDSLAAEAYRMNQQIEVLVSENRILTARAADMEARLKEMQTPAQPPPPPPVSDMSSAYGQALEQYRARDFSGAMVRFEQLIKGGVREDLADNCHYWIGECLYGMGKYGEAIQHFETALGFASSEKKDDSMLMIGNSHAAMGDKAAARDWFNRLITSYPASPYLAKAQEKLSRIQ